MFTKRGKRIESQQFFYAMKLDRAGEERDKRKPGRERREDRKQTFYQRSLRKHSRSKHRCSFSEDQDCLSYCSGKPSCSDEDFDNMALVNQAVFHPHIGNNHFFNGGYSYPCLTRSISSPTFMENTSHGLQTDLRADANQLIFSEERHLQQVCYYEKDIGKLLEISYQVCRVWNWDRQKCGIPVISQNAVFEKMMEIVGPSRDVESRPSSLDIQETRPTNDRYLGANGFMTYTSDSYCGGSAVNKRNGTKSRTPLETVRGHFSPLSNEPSDGGRDSVNKRPFDKRSECYGSYNGDRRSTDAWRSSRGKSKHCKSSSNNNNNNRYRNDWYGQHGSSSRSTSGQEQDNSSSRDSSSSPSSLSNHSGPVSQSRPRHSRPSKSSPPRPGVDSSTDGHRRLTILDDRNMNHCESGLTQPSSFYQDKASQERSRYKEETSRITTDVSTADYSRSVSAITVVEKTKPSQGLRISSSVVQDALIPVSPDEIVDRQNVKSPTGFSVSKGSSRQGHSGNNITFEGTEDRSVKRQATAEPITTEARIKCDSGKHGALGSAAGKKRTFDQTSAAQRNHDNVTGHSSIKKKCVTSVSCAPTLSSCTVSKSRSSSSLPPDANIQKTSQSPKAENATKRKHRDELESKPSMKTSATGKSVTGKIEGGSNKDILSYGSKEENNNSKTDTLNTSASNKLTSSKSSLSLHVEAKSLDPKKLEFHTAKVETKKVEATKVNDKALVNCPTPCLSSTVKVETKAKAIINSPKGVANHAIESSEMKDRQLVKDVVEICKASDKCPRSSEQTVKSSTSPVDCTSLEKEKVISISPERNDVLNKDDTKLSQMSIKSKSSTTILCPGGTVPSAVGINVQASKISTATLEKDRSMKSTLSLKPGLGEKLLDGSSAEGKDAQLPTKDPPPSTIESKSENNLKENKSADTQTASKLESIEREHETLESPKGSLVTSSSNLGIERSVSLPSSDKLGHTETEGSTKSWPISNKSTGKTYVVTSLASTSHAVECQTVLNLPPGHHSNTSTVKTETALIIEKSGMKVEMSAHNSQLKDVSKPAEVCNSENVQPVESQVTTCCDNDESKAVNTSIIAEAPQPLNSSKEDDPVIAMEVNPVDICHVEGTSSGQVPITSVVTSQRLPSIVAVAPQSLPNDNVSVESTKVPLTISTSGENSGCPMQYERPDTNTIIVSAHSSTGSRGAELPLYSVTPSPSNVSGKTFALKQSVSKQSFESENGGGEHQKTCNCSGSTCKPGKCKFKTEHQRSKTLCKQLSTSSDFSSKPHSMDLKVSPKTPQLTQCTISSTLDSSKIVSKDVISPSSPKGDALPEPLKEQSVPQNTDQICHQSVNSADQINTNDNTSATITNHLKIASLKPSIKSALSNLATCKVVLKALSPPSDDDEESQYSKKKDNQIDDRTLTKDISVAFDKDPVPTSQADIATRPKTLDVVNQMLDEPDSVPNFTKDRIFNEIFGLPKGRAIKSPPLVSKMNGLMLKNSKYSVKQAKSSINDSLDTSVESGDSEVSGKSKKVSKVENRIKGNEDMHIVTKAVNTRLRPRKSWSKLAVAKRNSDLLKNNTISLDSEEALALATVELKRLSSASHPDVDSSQCDLEFESPCKDYKTFKSISERLDTKSCDKFSRKRKHSSSRKQETEKGQCTQEEKDETRKKKRKAKRIYPKADENVNPSNELQQKSTLSSPVVDERPVTSNIFDLMTSAGVRDATSQEISDMIASNSKRISKDSEEYSRIADDPMYLQAFTVRLLSTALQKMKTRWRDSKDLCRKYSHEIDQLQKQNASHLSEIEKKHKDEIRLIEQDLESTENQLMRMTELANSQDKKITVLRTKQKSELSNLQKVHEKEIIKLKESLTKKEKCLEKKLNQSVIQVEKEKERCKALSEKLEAEKTKQQEDIDTLLANQQKLEGNKANQDKKITELETVVEQQAQKIRELTLQLEKQRTRRSEDMERTSNLPFALHMFISRFLGQRMCPPPPTPTKEEQELWESHQEEAESTANVEK